MLCVGSCQSARQGYTCVVCDPRGIMGWSLATRQHSEVHPMKWYDAVGNLHDLAQALVDAGHGPLDDQDWIYFLEKPWKWEREWLAWGEAGKPNAYTLEVQPPVNESKRPNP